MREIKEKPKVSEYPKDAPLFSIVVLTYLQRHLLNDCLDSVFEQDYPNIELVVCDDCSADFDPDEVRAYIDEHKEENIKKVTVYKQPQNAGTVKNAQTGIELSTGEFFKLQAGDDMLYKENSVGEMSRALSGPGVNIVAARSIACLHNGQMTGDVYPSSACFGSMINADAQTQYDLIATQAWGAYVNAPAVCWKRSFFDQIGGFDLSYRYMEDWPMWLKITGAGFRITYVDKIVVTYRYGGISSSQSETHTMFGEVFYAECLRMFQDEILPTFETAGKRKKVTRCKHCIRCIENRIIRETIWERWGFCKKLKWRMKNLDFLFLPWLYRTWYGVVPPRHTAQPLRIMAACLFLFYFHAEILPGQPADFLWSVLFFVAALWLVCELIFAVGVQFAVFALKRIQIIRGGRSAS